MLYKTRLCQLNGCVVRPGDNQREGHGKPSAGSRTCCLPNQSSRAAPRPGNPNTPLPEQSSGEAATGGERKARADPAR